MTWRLQYIFTCNKHYTLVGPIAHLLKYVTQTFICSAHSIKQESLANAKVSAQQQCMYEGP